MDVTTSRGSRMATDSRLKQSWMVAPPKARLNSSRLPDWASETKVELTDVPAFDPMIMKTAFVVSSAPLPTVVTMIDVVVLLLCSRTVSMTPTRNAVMGFAVSSFNLLVTPEPIAWKPRPRRPRPTKNMYRAARTQRNRMMDRAHSGKAAKRAYTRDVLYAHGRRHEQGSSCTTTSWSAASSSSYTMSASASRLPASVPRRLTSTRRPPALPSRVPLRDRRDSRAADPLRLRWRLWRVGAASVEPTASGTVSW
mmetsp:Transcript_4031/g.13115  ORF Transcript_4031/g.13115 Transcript_4031/m.13115 type:complete len:253 (-) Transcript_4031:42-800(-)